jgi:hypothetical protein
MKITKAQLKQIIKEELEKVMTSHDEDTLELAAELGLDPADYPAEGELEFEINKRMA